MEGTASLEVTCGFWVLTTQSLCPPPPIQGNPGTPGSSEVGAGGPKSHAGMLVLALPPGYTRGLTEASVRLL